MSDLVERLDNASALSNPAEADYCIALAATAIRSLTNERNSARALSELWEMAAKRDLARAEKAEADARALTARVGELEAALRFYAEPSGPVQIPDFYSELDFGSTARETLNEQTSIMETK